MLENIHWYDWTRAVPISEAERYDWIQRIILAEVPKHPKYKKEYFAFPVSSGDTIIIAQVSENGDIDIYDAQIRRQGHLHRDHVNPK